jgi:hypothetical protein
MLTKATQFPSSIPSSYIVMSSLNQPFLPSLSLTAPEILGVAATTGIPTTMGFAAAFPKVAEVHRTPENQVPTKSVRDIEFALNANWREISTQTKGMQWQNHQELENKTGLDVAVLALQ